MITNDQRQKDILNVCDIFNKENIDYIGTTFGEYSRYYDFTNEKIISAYQKLGLKDVNNALCVLSSGDHLFNLIASGIYNVDTFDCNRITEYYALGFKKSAIECLSYEQFLELFYSFGGELAQIKRISLEAEVIKNMPKKYQDFWTNFLNLRREYTCYPSVFELSLSTSNYLNGINYNNYLLTKSSYNCLRKNLAKAKITFNNIDIKEVPKILSTYDFIDFSNILMYYYNIFSEPKIENAQKFITTVYEKNLCSNGILKYCSGPNYKNNLLANQMVKNYGAPDILGIILNNPKEERYYIENEVSLVLRKN